MFSSNTPVTFTDLQMFAKHVLNLRVIDACVMFGRHQSHWSKDARLFEKKPVEAPLAILMRIISKYPCFVDFMLVGKHSGVTDLLALLPDNDGIITKRNLSLYIGSEGTATRGYKEGKSPNPARQRLIDLAVLALDPERNAAAATLWGQKVTPAAFMQEWVKAANDEALARGFGSMAGVADGNSWTKKGLERALSPAIAAEAKARAKRDKANATRAELERDREKKSAKVTADFLAAVKKSTSKAKRTAAKKATAKRVAAKSAAKKAAVKALRKKV